jgi:hypothetical protein
MYRQESQTFQEERKKKKERRAGLSEKLRKLREIAQKRAL